MVGWLASVREFTTVVAPVEGRTDESDEAKPFLRGSEGQTIGVPR
jgi:hypothetical protein